MPPKSRKSKGADPPATPRTTRTTRSSNAASTPSQDAPMTRARSRSQSTDVERTTRGSSAGSNASSQPTHAATRRTRSTAKLQPLSPLPEHSVIPPKKRGRKARQAETASQRSDTQPVSQATDHTLAAESASSNEPHPTASQSFGGSQFSASYRAADDDEQAQAQLFAEASQGDTYSYPAEVEDPPLDTGFTETGAATAERFKEEMTDAETPAAINEEDEVQVIEQVQLVEQVQVVEEIEVAQDAEEIPETEVVEEVTVVQQSTITQYEVESQYLSEEHDELRGEEEHIYDEGHDEAQYDIQSLSRSATEESSEQSEDYGSVQDEQRYEIVEITDEEEEMENQDDTVRYPQLGAVQPELIATLPPAASHDTSPQAQPSQSQVIEILSDSEADASGNDEGIEADGVVEADDVTRDDDVVEDDEGSGAVQAIQADQVVQADEVIEPDEGVETNEEREAGEVVAAGGVVEVDGVAEAVQARRAVSRDTQRKISAFIKTHPMRGVTSTSSIHLKEEAIRRAIRKGELQHDIMILLAQKDAEKDALVARMKADHARINASNLSAVHQQLIQLRTLYTEGRLTIEYIDRALASTKPDSPKKAPITNRPSKTNAKHGPDVADAAGPEIASHERPTEPPERPAKRARVLETTTPQQDTSRRFGFLTPFFSSFSTEPIDAPVTVPSTEPPRQRSDAHRPSRKRRASALDAESVNDEQPSATQPQRSSQRNGLFNRSARMYSIPSDDEEDTPEEQAAKEQARKAKKAELERQKRMRDWIAEPRPDPPSEEGKWAYLSGPADQLKKIEALKKAKMAEKEKERKAHRKEEEEMEKAAERARRAEAGEEHQGEYEQSGQNAQDENMNDAEMTGGDTSRGQDDSSRQNADSTADQHMMSGALISTSARETPPSRRTGLLGFFTEQVSRFIGRTTQPSTEDGAESSPTAGAQQHSPEEPVTPTPQHNKKASVPQSAPQTRRRGMTTQPVKPREKNADKRSRNIDSRAAVDQANKARKKKAMDDYDEILEQQQVGQKRRVRVDDLEYIPNPRSGGYGQREIIEIDGEDYIEFSPGEEVPRIKKKARTESTRADDGDQIPQFAPQPAQNTPVRRRETPRARKYRLEAERRKQEEEAENRRQAAFSRPAPPPGHRVTSTEYYGSIAAGPGDPGWNPNLFQQYEADEEAATSPSGQETAPPPMRTSSEEAEFQAKLRKTGHIKGSGVFAVPEGSDEEDSDISVTEEMIESQDRYECEEFNAKGVPKTSTFGEPSKNNATRATGEVRIRKDPDGIRRNTAREEREARELREEREARKLRELHDAQQTPPPQEPPQAPKPAHASLPGALTTVKDAAQPSAASGSLAESIARQRAVADKHKPKIPSGLRASSRLSTSTVASDDGAEDFHATANTQNLGDSLLNQGVTPTIQTASGVNVFNEAEKQLPPTIEQAASAGPIEATQPTSAPPATVSAYTPPQQPAPSLAFPPATPLNIDSAVRAPLTSAIQQNTPHIIFDFPAPEPVSASPEVLAAVRAALAAQPADFPQRALTSFQNRFAEWQRNSANNANANAAITPVATGLAA
ncbi:hypothetical protein W97_07928 [Coniosporium apollinis CBS 100218]|uniref:Uncharacterized protein n=1 Tax=Coniosporium apollinis (strain CBS 100218) TaxID=1168221 RepID=R7Z3B1_CONA1|nr:uncharacterized protein W97_07928 [Coniosporium apollinis CBS 100218]EON68670.1 hypothetical protein W97_07928 [Coniosporium apollinis CBS 100218]